MQQIFETYMRRLSNLTGSNRSLLLLRLTQRQFIDLHDFDFLNGKPSFHILQQLIGKEKQLILSPITDSRDSFSNEVSHRLKKLYRTAFSIKEESGGDDLYVGWPFVRGKFPGAGAVRAPLLFFPVLLTTTDKNWALQPRTDTGPFFNKNFLLAYAHYNGEKPQELLMNYAFDAFGKDSLAFRTELYNLLKNNNLELNFNSENFSDSLIPFKNYKKPDYEAVQKTGMLKLYPEAVLGIFPQAGSYLMPDYLKLIENETLEGLDTLFSNRHVAAGSFNKADEQDNPLFLHEVKEEEVITPFLMDACQEHALKASKKGQALVVQGPPGSGKSQFICNLITDTIAAGKNVLLVCQKRVALDVVYERLSRLGLTDFIGLVHDFKSDRPKMYKKISRQVDQIPAYQKINNSLNAIQLERKFLQASRRIDQITEKMEAFRKALYDESQCGISVKELYLTADPDKPSIILGERYRHFRMDETDPFITKLKRYTVYFKKFSSKDHPWSERVSFAKFGVSDLKNIKEAIDDVIDFQTDDHPGKTYFGFEELIFLLSKRRNLALLEEYLPNEAAYKLFLHYAERETDLEWFSHIKDAFMACYEGHGPEKSLPASSVQPFYEVLQKQKKAGRTFFSRIWWHLFAKEKLQIKQVLKDNQLIYNKKNTNILYQKVKLRLRIEGLREALKEKSWIDDVPQSHDEKVMQNWFCMHLNALQARQTYNEISRAEDYFTIHRITYHGFIEKLKCLLEGLEKLDKRKERWLTYLTPGQINSLFTLPSFSKEYTETLKRDFEDLCNFDQLRSGFSAVEQEVVSLLSASKEEDMVSLFQNSLRLAWIEHIESYYPTLRSVSSLAFSSLEEDLRESVQEKQKLSQEMLLLKARERLYQNITYNRLNNRVTYRDLYYQVNKKKKIWPLRKTVAQFGEELFDLLPCWMASPESVSCIFPMEILFDLVIFDEASQCFVEKAIPAMYRGKQIVICGDDKQLIPNNLYKIRWEEPDDDTPDLGIDSLLDLGQHYLTKVSLEGHYRSKLPDLIYFSNLHFYEGRLKMIPDCNDLNKQEAAIQYIKVEGVWEDHINKQEAEETVNLVRQLTLAFPEKEIGVITFNARQQDHILDLLDKPHADQMNFHYNNLFVKNIENVQGDERDIIIFSIAYAPDVNGRMSMQFGSLNVAGGENRLNVAITRAREKIFVVSSILPQQLKVDNSKNKGPWLLKEYLTYAWEISQGVFSPPLQEEKKHPVDWLMYQKLKTLLDGSLKGYELASTLDFADLTIKKDDEYLGIILTDDELYHESLSIKDAHAYKPATLHQKHWHFKHYYSRHYWQRRDKIKEEILNFMIE